MLATRAGTLTCSRLCSVRRRKSQVKYSDRGAFLAGSLVISGWASTALWILNALVGLHFS